MIDWIPVETRVPDTRRRVLVFGRLVFFGHSSFSDAVILITKFNPSPSNGRFDCERQRRWWGNISYQVTDWAELTEPARSRVLP